MSDVTHPEPERAVHRVGRYEILRELGRGGMAVVYLARQLDLDRFVALKELHAFMATEPTYVRRFLRETHLSASLTHPNIVTVYDAFDWEGVPYLAMEYLPCGSLRPLIGRLSFAQIAGVMEAVLAGLAHAEAAGIVHRDLKPENLLIASEGRLKIADFGIAKAVHASTSVLTATGSTIGTPAYMAPEQAMARGLGPWTDLYATGVIAYELVCGRVPFEGKDEPLAVLLQHINDPVPWPASLVAGVPEAVVPWIMRLLEKEPRDRFQTATDAWNACEDVVLDALGPRWRRGARLPAGGESDGAELPLTPAAFERAPDAGEYETFSQRKPSPPPTTAETERALPPEPPPAPPPEVAEYETFIPPTPPRPPAHTSESALPAFPTGAVAPPPEPEVAEPAPEPEPLPDPEPVVAEPALDPEPLPAPEPALATTLAPTTPPPPGEPVAVRRRWPWLVVAALCALLVATVLVVGRGGGTKQGAPPVVRTASNGTLSVRFAAPWSRVSSAPGIPGLRLGRPITLSAGASGRMYAGMTAATGASLVPASFVDRLAGALPAPEHVRLGALSALGYRDLEVASLSGRVAVFVVPTDSGVLTLAFAYPKSSPAAAGALARLAAQVKLLRGSAYPPAPRAEYAAALSSAVRKPLADVGRNIDALRRAKTRLAQASAAAAVSGALGRARSATASGQLRVSPRDGAAQSALATAFARTGSAYSALAAAARAGRRKGYEAARAQARRSESSIGAAMTEFAKLGYRVPGSALPAAAGAPALLRVPRLPAPPALRPVARHPAPTATAVPAPTATIAPSTPVKPAPTRAPSTPTPSGGGGGGSSGGGGEG